MSIGPAASGRAAIAAATLAFGCAAETADRPEAPAPPEPVVWAEGLNGPMGVLVAPDGAVWVVDSGLGGDLTVRTPDPVTRQIVDASFGETSRIVRIDPSGEPTEVARLPSLLVGGTAFGGGRLAMIDDAVYVTSGGWVPNAERPPTGHCGVVRIVGGEVAEIANLREIEATRNPDPAQLESNPFGLAAGPDGMLWVTDAAGNALYRVDPGTGDIELVAVLASMPGAVPNPARGDALEIEPVPTAVAFMDGEAYVSYLPGLPMAPGTARVVRVSPDGAVTDHATGLSRLIDLQAGPDGRLYAVSMADPAAEGPTGSVIRIGPGETSRPILTGLAFPTALAFDGEGNAYVTVNGVGAPGTGQVLRYAGLVQVDR